MTNKISDEEEEGKGGGLGGDRGRQGGEERWGLWVCHAMSWVFLLIPDLTHEFGASGDMPWGTQIFSRPTATLRILEPNMVWEELKEQSLNRVHVYMYTFFSWLSQSPGQYIWSCPVQNELKMILKALKYQWYCSYGG